MRAAPSETTLSGAPLAWPVHAALLGAQTGFALFPIFGKLALSTIPPLVLAALRIVSAALLLDLLRRLASAPPVAPRDRGATLLYALLGASANQVLFVFGLSLTTAINTTVLTAAIPVLTLAAAVMLGRERLTARAAVGVALAGAGALVLLNVQNFDWNSRLLRGNLLLLASSLGYSFYLVLSRPLLARTRALSFVSAVFLYGAPPIVALAIPALRRFSPSGVSTRSWWSLAAVVLFCTVLPYLFNSWALARAKASQVAFYVFVQPLIASTLAIVILGETLTGKTLAAAGLIFAGLGVSLVDLRLPFRPIP